MLGLVISQLLPGALGAGYASFKTCSDTLLYVCLGFIMINVGREFEIDKSRWRSYTADYFIAMATAALPWLLIVGGALYSIGGVLYALKWPNPWPRTFGHHEFFHAATVVAALCHYTAIWLLLLR